MLHPEIINLSPMYSFQKAELSRNDSSANRNYCKSTAGQNGGCENVIVTVSTDDNRIKKTATRIESSTSLGFQGQHA